MLTPEEITKITEINKSNIIINTNDKYQSLDGTSDIDIISFHLPSPNPLIQPSYDGNSMRYNTDTPPTMSLQMTRTFNMQSYKLNLLYLSLFNVDYYHILPLFLLSQENPISIHDKLPFVTDDITLLFGLNYLINIKKQYEYELETMATKYHEYSSKNIYNLMFNAMVITNYINGTPLLSDENKEELVLYFNGNINKDIITVKLNEFITFINSKESSYESVNIDLINRKYSYILNTFNIPFDFDIDDINNKLSTIAFTEQYTSEIDRNV